MVSLVRTVLALASTCALATGTAAAAPLATLTKDVDGDGSDDTIELDAGELRIQTRKGTSKVALGVRPGRVTLSGAVARGMPTIVVQTADTGYVFQRAGAVWKQVAKSTVGGVGLDSDYAVALDVNTDGVYRYQTRAGHRRCDGKPALLFAERLDGGTFTAVQALPTFVPAGAQAITARAEQAPTITSPMMFKARYASHQPGAPDAGALAIPAELDDGKPQTVWREELAGAGEGHFVTYTARLAGATATQLRIVPAKIKNLNRPQRLGVVSAQGAWHVELPDSAKDTGKATVYVVDLPTPIADCVTVVIESTYGTAGATAFGELQVWSDNEYGRADAMFARVIAAGGDGSVAATQVLTHRGAAGVTAIDTEIRAGTGGEAGRARLILAVTANPDPSKGPLLARAVTEGWITGNDLVLALQALAGLGQGQALHDIAARQGVTLPARIAAARALDPNAEKERELLVALAGRGPRELRQAVIETLTNAPVATLAPIAAAQPKPTAAGDLWRAITRRAHATPEERGPALAALTAALATAADYERRYRIVDGIAAVGDAAALRSLQQLLATWPADAETSAIKQIAARAIAVNPRPDALELIVALATDADPGVRLSALSAIASAPGAAGTPGTTGTAGPWHRAPGADGIDRVIITRLATDTWPEVRRYAAQVLGVRCTGPGPAAALGDAVTRDPDLGVRGDALAALVECKAPTAAALLAKLWDDSKAPLELRQRAVDLSVTLADRALAQKLVGKYTQWRGAAIESEAALALAQNAAYAIGRLRVPGAAEALIAALDDSAFPELVASAATGIGLLGPGCPASVRSKLKALSRSDEQQVQIAASRAVDVCGK
jgi:hypothetical protein